MTEANLRAQAVAKINSWIGLKESNNSHMTIINIYNSHSPKARGYTMTSTDAWCATTVSAVGIALGITANWPAECSCSKMIELYQALGRWMETDSYVPTIGDLMMYDWGDSGTGDCTGAPEHVGMVTAVNGNTITVVEGNKSDAVGTRTMTVNGKYIRGYCLPDYQTAAWAMDVTTSDDAIEKLADIGIIDSPDYWKTMVAGGTVYGLSPLFVKSANKIAKKGTRLATSTAGVAALVGAGVVTSPDIWLDAAAESNTVGALLMALGGAV